MSRSPSVLVAGLVLAVAATACAGGSAPPTAGDGRLDVVVTTTILGDVVTDLVGDDGDVEVLIPAGADPHDFAASAAQVAAVRDADLVVANGLGLEASLGDVLTAARDDGIEVLELAPRLDPLPTRSGEEGDDHGEDDHGEEDHGGGLDPHVWFDPVRMADGVRILAAALAAADDTVEDAEWTRRGDELAAQLLALDEELRGILAPIPPERRVLVTNHESLGYLAARYDLGLVGTVVPGGSTLGAASAERLAELADLLRERDVPAVFAENVGDDRIASALAREVGGDVEVVSLYTDALGDPGSGADTYAGLLRTDARLIAEALTR